MPNSGSIEAEKQANIVIIDPRGLTDEVLELRETLSLVYQNIFGLFDRTIQQYHMLLFMAFWFGKMVKRPML